jgi:outer membrane receptor protein involved in Fe transport
MRMSSVRETAQGAALSTAGVLATALGRPSLALGVPAILAAATWASATAQSVPPAEGAETPLAEVVVTGSRIPVPANITATSPITVVTTQDIALSGHTDVVDILNDLPQTIINSSADYGNHSNPANAAGGFATADLRGLGPQRTIVLINGRRLGIGDANTANPASAADLDQIPTAMVERIEVVTGGASATYGSDAVAGVVNFILKEHVQGVQIDAQYGFAQHDQHNSYIQGRETAVGITPPTGSTIDGSRRDLSILAGSDFSGGQGQVTAFFGYHGLSALTGSERDFSACDALSRNAITGVPSQPGFTCFGSSNSNRFVTLAGTGISYSVVGNQFVPWPVPDSVPPPRFNNATYQYIQRQDTRYQAGLFGHLQLAPALRPYVEFTFMDDRTVMAIAPSGLFGGSNPLTFDGTDRVNCSNPLLSPQEAAILCTPAQIAADQAHPGSVSADVDIARRNIEGGGRSSDFEHRSYRFVGGVGGEFADAFSYDAYALYFYTSLFQSELNYLNYAAINNALQVTTNATGHPVCIVGGRCVPYNIFATGAVTSQQLAYLYTPGTDGGSNTEEILATNVTGELGRFGIVVPWAREGIGVNAGVEYRLEKLRFAPDAAELSGVLAGYGGAAVAVDQHMSVNELFAETRVPIVQNRPLVKDLTMGAGYRRSQYSTAGAANAYKFDVQYAPNADVRLRYSYDRVVRAPNITEVYTPLSYTGSQTVGSDPCAPTNDGKKHAVAGLTACEHTGVTPAEYGNGLGPAAGGTSTLAQCPFGCGSVIGGNLGLVPETAQTWSVGLTVTPTALAAFTMSVDYFHILLEREIATVPGSVSLQQCLASADPTACSKIVRTPLGALSGASVAGGGYILENNVNTGTALVSGIDLQLNGHWPLSASRGALNVSLIGTWLQHDAVTPYQGAASYDCAGLFGNTCLGGSVSPHWRHNLRVTWETPWKTQLSAQWRYIGPASFDNNSSQPALKGAEEGFYDPVIARIPSVSYLDLAAIWGVTRHVQVRAGIRNLFDKDPPFIPAFDISPTAGSLNTFPTYDVMGRWVYLALTATL